MSPTVRPMRRVLPLLLPLLLPLALVLTGCGGDSATTETSTTTTAPEEESSTTAGDGLPTDACDAAFEQAAQPGEMEDTVENLYPAARACESIADWTAASEQHPDALDGADPEGFAINVCAYGEDVADSPLCQEVNAS